MPHCTQEGKRSLFTSAAPAAQGVVFLSIAHVALVFFGYSFHLIGSRALDQADYGRFVVVLSVINWIKVLLTSMLVPGIAKVVSEDHSRLDYTLKATGRWYWYVSFGVMAVMLLCAPFAARALGDLGLTMLLVVAALETPLFAAFSMGKYLLNALRRYAASAACMMTYSVVRAAGACLFLLMGMGALGGIAGLLIGSLAAAIVGVPLLERVRRTLPRTDYPSVTRRALAWTGIWLPSSIALSTLISLDMWIVKGALPDAALAGLYGAAYAASRLPDSLVQGLMHATFARVSGALGERKVDLARSVTRETFRAMIVLFTPVCLLTAACSKEIMTLLFTKKFADGGTILTLLVISISFASAIKLILSLLAAADKPAVRLGLVGALLPIHAVLTYLMTAKYGLIGAAVASVITMSAGMVIGVVMLHRELRVLPPPLSLLRCGLCGAAVYFLARSFAAHGLILIVALASMCALYMALLFVTGEMKPKHFASFVRKRTHTEHVPQTSNDAVIQGGRQ